MTKLEDLIYQKKKLEEQIALLKGDGQQFGNVRMSRSDSRGGFYSVQTLVKTFSEYDKGERWQITIRERTKKEVAHSLRVIITDMSELLQSIEKEAAK